MWGCQTFWSSSEESVLEYLEHNGPTGVLLRQISYMFHCNSCMRWFSATTWTSFMKTTHKYHTITATSHMICVILLHCLLYEMWTKLWQQILNQNHLTWKPISVSDTSYYFVGSYFLRIQHDFTLLYLLLKLTTIF